MATRGEQAMIGLRNTEPLTCARSLRIAHIIDSPFNAKGANGVQQVVLCLARAQAAIGQSVAVFSSVDGTHFLGPDAELPPSIPGTLRGHSGHSLAERFISRYLNRTIAEAVLAWRPGILHLHSVHVPHNIALADYLCRAGIPYCVTVHGGLFPAALRRGRLKKAVFNLLFERRYLNDARFIHAVSPHEVVAIRQYGVEGTVVVVPNGLPPDATMPPSQPDALYRANPWLRDRQVFMFIGRLDPWQKGLDVLLEGFWRAGLRDAALVLVGSDCRGSRRSLERRAAKFGISPQVVFTGPAFGEDRANLFAAADVFVHPSRWEGLSLSVLAAAAAGKPCLITRDADPLGGLERAGAAVLVEPTVASVAAGLRQAATLSGCELQMMSTRARHVAEGYFTWPTIARTLMAAYESGLGNGEDRRVDADAARTVRYDRQDGGGVRRQQAE